MDKLLLRVELNYTYSTQFVNPIKGFFYRRIKFKFNFGTNFET